MKAGNLSYHVGEKTLNDSKEWAPDMNLVRATIRFTLITGRLEIEDIT